MKNKIVVFRNEDSESEYEFIKQQLNKIGTQTIKRLVNEALKARKNAYQPYSNYSVGASVLFSSGKTYSAPNNEVVNYSQTGHAEGNSIACAIASGEGRKKGSFIDALVVCHEGNTMPCGACRQQIAEHAKNGNAIVIQTNDKGKLIAITSLHILLPYAFLPEHLNK